MHAGEDGSYWERACHFFRGSGFANTAGSYFLHNKNAATVRIGIVCQASVTVGDGRLRVTQDGRETTVALHPGEPVFKRVENHVRQDAPCFFVVSPDIHRRFVDRTLPQIVFVQPAIELTFSPARSEGWISYARDVMSEQLGQAMLQASLANPLPVRPGATGDRRSFDELAAGWVPAESDESFVGRLTDAVAVLREYPDGKMTLTRAYEHRSDVRRSPFDLYELHARMNGEYACSHFFCVGKDIFSLGVTPENVFELDGSTLTVDVVAATCGAGGGADHLAAELYGNPKEIKEHRSSLGNRQDRFRPFCVDGSIVVTQDMRVKELRNVCHLHSVFTGELSPRVTAFDLMGNIFPLLGARPKELRDLADAEEAPHRYYGGVVGHLHGESAGCFLNIRNALLYDNVIHAKVGVGVIKESNPHRELVETRQKLSGLLEAVQLWERSASPLRI